MPQSSIRKAVRLALESILSSATDRDAALKGAEAEILQMMGASDKATDSAAILIVVHQEIIRARAAKN